MGGLIVKEAYLQGQNDPTYEDIIGSVSSIIFLSTPHRGTNLAETLNRILQVSFTASPMQFIAELAAGSQTLQRLNEQFRHVAPRLDIVSFYETRPTTVFRKTQIVSLVDLYDLESQLTTAPRWSWRKTRPCWATQARCRSPSTQTTMGSASTTAQRTIVTSLFETLSSQSSPSLDRRV